MVRDYVSHSTAFHHLAGLPSRILHFPKAQRLAWTPPHCTAPWEYHLVLAPYPDTPPKDSWLPRTW